MTNIEDGVKAADADRLPRAGAPQPLCWAAGPCRSWPTSSMLRRYLKTAVEVDEDKPVLVDKYIIRHVR